MGEDQPDQAGRRSLAVRALAGYRAAGRCSRDDPRWDEVYAEALTEVEADPGTDAAIAMADAAPPMDPETRRDVRRLLREMARDAPAPR